jgi:4a-hydroxytetrahydrobiopterin dehydratase
MIYSHSEQNENVILTYIVCYNHEMAGGFEMKLNEAEIEQQLALCEGWKREDGKWVVKKYRFRTFMDAVAFVNKIAEVSEQLNHHPLIAIDYKMVTLRLTTWSDGGLTNLDFKTAAAFDQAFARD